MSALATPGSGTRPDPGTTARLFADLATTPRTRGPLLAHGAGALALSTALSWSSRDTTAAALQSLGVEDPGAAVTAIAVLVVGLGTLLLLGALALGAVLLHVGSRLAGADRAFPVSASTYLVATSPLWVRNLLLAVALVLGLDPARLGSLAIGDPFLLLAGGLAAVGLHEVHRLSWPRAAVVASVTVLGGVAVGLLGAVAS